MTRFHIKEKVWTSKTQSIIFVICLFGTLELHSQEILNNDILTIGDYNGYVVTIEDDTLKGTITIKGKDTKVHNEITFRSDQDHDTIFYPSDLKSFHISNYHFIGNSIVHLDAIPEYRNVFLQQLIDGYLKYYRLLNYQLASGGPIPVMKTVEYYYVSYGNLKPNRIRYFKDLAIYTRDHFATDSLIMNGHYQKEELPKILNDYNLWLHNQDKFNYLKNRDSLLSKTSLTLEEALDNSLLYYNMSDSSMHNYFFRLLYYAYNSSDYKSYIIYDKRDQMNRPIELGLKINLSNGYKNVGTWRYYYKNKQPGLLHLYKEESYDPQGELHGTITTFDRSTGQILKKVNYYHGKKQHD